MATRKRVRPRAAAVTEPARRGRKRDNLSTADAKLFRAWLDRVRQRWKARGHPWIGTLVKRAPCRKRADGSTEHKLPQRDRDWFMRGQNENLPLSRGKAIEICLRLFRHGIEVANDNIVRMLMDTTDDKLVILPAGGAIPLTNHLIEGLKKRANPINEAGRDFLRDYLTRFESLTRRNAHLREAVFQFESRYRHVGWWKLSNSGEFDEGKPLVVLSLFTRLERESRTMKWDVRERKSDEDLE
jgi:hypothetical protein